MNDKVKSFTDILTKKLGNKKTMGIIMALGICGIVLIGFSDSFFSREKRSGDKSVVTLEQYVKDLENKTVKMLDCIEGAGKCKIMITAEASSEQNYATDDSISQDIRGDQSSGKSDIEKEIVMVEDANGKKIALIKSVTEPKIRGVLVLCEGANNVEIKEKITNAVKILLGVSASKISVIKMK